ncbi:MAG: TlpA family protein disulfide reductase [Acidimicrobiales bacterium]
MSSDRKFGESGQWRRYAGGAVAVVVIVVALVVARTGNSAEKVPTGRAPAAEAFQTLDGSSASFEKYRGRPPVVNFFASWCAPCLAEMPGFERVSQDLGDRVAFLGINLQDSSEAGRRVVEQTGITYDVARDPSGALFKSFGAIAMPTTVLIDANGKVVDLISGELSARSLRDRIDKALLS